MFKLNMVLLALAVGLSSLQAGTASRVEGWSRTLYLGVLYLGLSLALCGAAFGIIGLFQRAQLKRISALGLVLNVLLALAFVFVAPTLHH
jgi:hypothetical protein